MEASRPQTESTKNVLSSAQDTKFVLTRPCSALALIQPFISKSPDKGIPDSQRGKYEDDVFYDVVSCDLVEINRNFRQVYLHHQSKA
jgi:hypothetical protein